MIKTYLILGSNLGNRREYLKEARFQIEKSIGPVMLNSSLYETEPWGFVHENLFINQVIQILTSLSAKELLEGVKKIELQLGRTKGKERYTARTIDIDILAYNELVMITEELTIPHAELANRRFVLEPLAEIAPEWIHPKTHQGIMELLEICPDRKSVKKIEMSLSD
jgi:2-amino-4-hydroxy-6-hydroxymethyldihydropteridine diphosphokinase